MRDSWLDARHGARLLRRSPLFAFVALATLAVEVSAVTAIFAVVHAVILRPLPFREPERLVALWEGNPERSEPPRGSSRGGWPDNLSSPVAAGLGIGLAQHSRFREPSRASSTE